MSAKTTIEKLGILLPHWIEHNRSHAAEFRRWAKSAKREGVTDVAELLDLAAASLTATGNLLKKAGKGVGGKGTGHRHTHSHCHEHGAEHEG